MTKVAIIQSNYIPWKGYFDIIHDVDLFLFCDDLQYTKKDWRNRNRIKTTSGTRWLTVPVGDSLKRNICDVRLAGNAWQKKHWEALKQAYARTRYFNTYREFFEHVYLGKQWTNLSELNQALIVSIAKDLLGITTAFGDSREYHTEGKKLDRALDLLRQVNAGVYVSGPAARSYIDEQRFADAGIALIYKDYAGYPEYPQSYPPFDHAVTVLDLLFHCGDDAPHYIWGWREAGLRDSVRTVERALPSSMGPASDKDER